MRESRRKQNYHLLIGVAMAIILIVLGWLLLHGVVPCIPMWACVEADRSR